MTIAEVFATYDAPWDIIELAADSKFLRESGRYFGVENKSGHRIAAHVTLSTATLIACAPEMLALIEEIAEDDQSEHRYSAKLLLNMMAARSNTRQEKNQ